MSIPPVAAASDAPSGAGSVLMQVAGLSRRYGDRGALAGVSFDVHAGEVLGLIGPNGAGKTTLLETVAGLLPADSGEVIWRGAAVHAGRRREVLFYLPRRPASVGGPICDASARFLRFRVRTNAQGGFSYGVVGRSVARSWQTRVCALEGRA